MALYPAAVKRLIPPGPTDPRIKPRVAILHVDAMNATGENLHTYFRDRSGGVESHFHIEFDGTVYQYRDTDYEADANWDANDFAVSIETQGKAAGEWTPAQLAAIKALLTWLNRTHGIPLVKCPRWDGSGVGYHILFMAEWAGGPRACPGPDRIRQFHSLLVPWMASGAPTTAQEDDDVTPEDIKAIADEVLKRPVRDLEGNTLTVGAAIGITLRNSAVAATDARVTRALAEASAKAGKPLTTAEIDDIARATIAALGADYNAKVELTPKEG